MQVDYRFLDGVITFIGMSTGESFEMAMGSWSVTESLLLTISTLSYQTFYIHLISYDSLDVLGRLTGSGIVDLLNVIVRKQERELL